MFVTKVSTDILVTPFTVNHGTCLWPGEWPLAGLSLGSTEETGAWTYLSAASASVPAASSAQPVATRRAAGPR